MNQLYELFKAKAEAVGAEVGRVDTRAAALDLIAERLKAQGVTDTPGRTALWAACPFLEDLDLDELSARIPGLGFDVTRAGAGEARVGISQMDWAVADTGTLAQDATAVDQRLVSTLPVTHIALVPADHLVPDLASLLAVLGPRNARYLSLITGPSRTSDIERVLTIGVHGPEQLIIIFVGELERVAS